MPKFIFKYVPERRSRNFSIRLNDAESLRIVVDEPKVKSEFQAFLLEQSVYNYDEESSYLQQCHGFRDTQKELELKTTNPGCIEIPLFQKDKAEYLSKLKLFFDTHSNVTVEIDPNSPNNQYVRDMLMNNGIMKPVAATKIAFMAFIFALFLYALKKDPIPTILLIAGAGITLYKSNPGLANKLIHEFTLFANTIDLMARKKLEEANAASKAGHKELASVNNRL